MRLLRSPDDRKRRGGWTKERQKLVPRDSRLTRASWVIGPASPRHANVTVDFCYLRILPFAGTNKAAAQDQWTFGPSITQQNRRWYYRINRADETASERQRLEADFFDIKRCRFYMDALPLDSKGSSSATSPATRKSAPEMKMGTDVVRSA